MTAVEAESSHSHCARSLRGQGFVYGANVDMMKVNLDMCKLQSILPWRDLGCLLTAVGAGLGALWDGSNLTLRLKVHHTFAFAFRPSFTLARSHNTGTT